MTEDSSHHTLRLPKWLWEQYGKIVGNLGRTPDLKIYMDWQLDNPNAELGDDVAGPCDFSTTLRIEPERWAAFMSTVGKGDCTEEMRRYIWWRVQHPRDPLPGRKLGPLRRERRLPVPA